MWSAANEGNFKLMVEAIEAGEDIEFTDAMGRTPLIEAVKYQHVACVEELLARGANPFACSFLGSVMDYTHGNKRIEKLLKVARKEECSASLPCDTSKTEDGSSSDSDVIVSVDRPVSKTICRYQKRGFCRNGANCRFSHDVKVATEAKKKRIRKEARICRFFALGNCKFGSKCRFSHTEKENISSDSAISSPRGNKWLQSRCEQEELDTSSELLNEDDHLEFMNENMIRLYEEMNRIVLDSV